MKKFILLLLLLTAGFSYASAQTQRGVSSLGFNVGYAFDTNNATLGVDYRYCLTDAVRLNPSLTHFVKNDGWNAWAIDMNVHYVVQVTDLFGFYPLAGLDLSFWRCGLGNGLSLNETRFGANIGLGGEVYASNNITVGMEVKYNIVKDIDQALMAFRVGYNF